METFRAHNVILLVKPVYPKKMLVSVCVLDDGAGECPKVGSRENDSHNVNFPCETKYDNVAIRI
jgi:hypothetical protein